MNNIINEGNQIIINGKTKITGIFGDPVEHSLSPAMHNAAFQEKGLNYCYLPIRVSRADLPAAVKAIPAFGISGVNITAPHKEAVIPYLDELSPEAAFLKAVNTIEHKKGKLIGHNTDIEGFLYLLESSIAGVPLSDKVCLLGAGGAAKAVCLALSKAGFRQLVIANRTLARAEMLAGLLVKGNIFQKQKVNVIELHRSFLHENFMDAALIINALSEDPAKLGLLSGKCIRLPECRAVIDLRYGSRQIPFKKWADEHGILFLDGLDMLLGQGLRAFELFTGEKAPVQTMKEVLQCR